MTELLWWGYRHTNNSIQVKRFFDDQDLSEARESPFCETVVGPFPAGNREQALLIAESKLPQFLTE